MKPDQHPDSGNLPSETSGPAAPTLEELIWGLRVVLFLAAAMLSISLLKVVGSIPHMRNLFFDLMGPSASLPSATQWALDHSHFLYGITCAAIVVSSLCCWYFPKKIALWPLAVSLVIQIILHQWLESALTSPLNLIIQGMST